MKYLTFRIGPKVVRSGPTVIVPPTVAPDVIPVIAGTTGLFTVKLTLSSWAPLLSVMTAFSVWAAFVRFFVS